MESMFVSSSRCCVFVSRVHPEVIRSAVFCTVCSLFVLVSDIIGDQIMLPYSSVVLVMAVYVLSRVCLDFRRCMVVRAFTIFVVLFALSLVFCLRLRKCVSDSQYNGLQAVGVRRRWENEGL